jgi:hypothetical protein
MTEIRDSIDAIHFTYKQPVAAAQAQISFFSTYPKGKVLCIVDKGGTAPIFENNPTNLEIKISQNKISAQTNGLYLDKNTIHDYLSYLLDSCNLRTDSEWLLILEDDVKFFKHVEKLAFGLNGVNFTERLSRRVRLLFTFFGHSFSNGSFYGGCGGSIIRKTIINKYPLEKWNSILNKFIFITGRPLGADEVVSIMTVLAGEKLGQYDGFTETWQIDYHHKLETNQISTLHKYREFYV